MSTPVDTAARWAGGVFGALVGIAVLATIGNATSGEGLQCSSDTTVIVTRDTVTVDAPPAAVSDTVHPTIPPQVAASLDSLTAEVAKRDSALAAWIAQSRREVYRVMPYRVDVDSSRIVIGRVAPHWCPENGVLSAEVWVDTLIVPESVLRIVDTVVVSTGIEWWYLPAAVIVGVLLGWLAL